MAIWFPSFLNTLMERRMPIDTTMPRAVANELHAARPGGLLRNRFELAIEDFGNPPPRPNAKSGVFTIQDYVGGGQFSAPPITDGRCVGVEIEIEGVREFLEGRLGDMRSDRTVQLGPYWQVKADGSLRNNGAEFITPPVQLAVAENVLKEFYGRCAKKPHWQGSARCGIHVHADCRDYGQANLVALYAAYSLVEPALFEYVGNSREECIYCIPWYRAPSDANFIAKEFLVTQMPLGDVLYHIENGFNRVRLSKYSAFYWGPLSWYGTVEFRQAPTWMTIGETLPWVRACWSIVDYCSTRTEAQIWDEWRSSPRSFLQRLVGENIPISPGAINAVGFWDIEARIELLHKVAADDGWVPRMMETGIGKRKKRKKEKVPKAVAASNIWDRFQFDPPPAFDPAALDELMEEYLHEDDTDESEETI